MRTNLQANSGSQQVKEKKTLTPWSDNCHGLDMKNIVDEVFFKQLHSLLGKIIIKKKKASPYILKLCDSEIKQYLLNDFICGFGHHQLKNCKAAFKSIVL